jgi:hypothetical protein
VWYRYGTTRSPDGAGSNHRFLGFSGAVRDTESVVDGLVTRFWAGGFADVKGFSVGALEFDRHAVLPAELSAHTFSAERNVAGLELNTNYVHEMIGQHRDKQMGADASGFVVKYRTQAQLRFETAKHRLQVGEQGIRVPQRGLIPLVLIGAQTVHPGEGLFDGFDAPPMDGAGLPTGLIVFDTDLLVLGRAGILLLLMFLMVTRRKAPCSPWQTDQCAKTPSDSLRQRSGFPEDWRSAPISSPRAAGA